MCPCHLGSHGPTGLSGRFRGPGSRCLSIWPCAPALESPTQAALVLYYQRLPSRPLEHGDSPCRRESKHHCCCYTNRADEAQRGRVTHLKLPSRARAQHPHLPRCLPQITVLCEWAHPVPTAKEGALRTPALQARTVKAGELHRHLMNTQAQGDREGKGCRENRSAPRTSRLLGAKAWPRRPQLSA